MHITFTDAQQCPRCHAFELILDPRSHRDNNVEWCPVCGFVRDDRDGDIPLPHHSLQYSMEGVLVENLIDIEELYGELPVHDLAESDVWLKARESEGYVFAKCVIVNEYGHVIWLRGNPSNWNWDGNN